MVDGLGRVGIVIKFILCIYYTRIASHYDRKAAKFEGYAQHEEGQIALGNPTSSSHKIEYWRGISTNYLRLAAVARAKIK